MWHASPRLPARMLCFFKAKAIGALRLPALMMISAVAVLKTHFSCTPTKDAPSRTLGNPAKGV
jgi:hypothetical protein